MKKRGFTLAEVLVTLGIIGVVSAMTIPSLTQNWQKKSYVTQLHKVYNIFQQAFIEDMNENQAVNVAEAGIRNFDQSTGRNFMQKHFKIIKECGQNTSSGCFATQYRSLNGNSSSNVNFSGYNFVIAGGAAVAIYVDSIDTGDEYTDDYFGYINVDVNGPKGPNIRGRDLFTMYFFGDGVLDAWHINPACRKNGTSCSNGNSAKQARENLFNSYCKNNTTWDQGGCFAKILNDNWEMNY